MVELATTLATAQAVAMSTPTTLQPDEAAVAAPPQASADGNFAQAEGALPTSADANLSVPAAGGGDANTPGPGTAAPTDPWLRTFVTTLASIKSDQCAGTCGSVWGGAPLAYGFIKAGTQYFLILPGALDALTPDGSAFRSSQPRHAITGAPDGCQATMESSETFTLNGDNLIVRIVATTVVSCRTESTTCLCDVQLSGYPKA